jgi:hypothetical protein
MRYKKPAFYVCTLLSVFAATSASAAPKRGGSRKSFTGQTTRMQSAMTLDPSAEGLSTDVSQSEQASEGGSIELAPEITVPTFMSDVDESLMSDELMSHIEEQYSEELQEFSLRNGFYQQDRSSRSDANVILSEAEEIQVRQSMASSMKKYMLLRGVPKFLGTRDATKNLGQAYSKTVAMARGATRVTLGGKERNSWKFSTGVNPFTGKGWAKYGNASWNVETSDYIDQDDALALVVSKKWSRYTAHSSYMIEQEKLSSGFDYQIRKDLSSGLSASVPLAVEDTLDRSVTNVKLRYSF